MISGEAFRAVAESATDAIVLADETGRITYANPAARRLFGLPPDGAVGRPLADLMPERFHEAHRRGLERFLRTGEGRVMGRTIELAGRRADGTEFPVELSLSTWSEGGRRYFSGILRDVADRKRLEAEAAAAREGLEETVRVRTADLDRARRDIETLFYAASHDLQEPLRSVEAFAERLRERYADRLDETGRDYVRRIERAAVRMRRLLVDLLTLSRAQGMGAPEETVPLGEAVGEALGRFDDRILQTRARVRVEEGLPAVRAHRTWVVEAVANLVSNALKYVRDGEVPDVEIGPYDGPEGVGIAVRDRGPGLPPEMGDRIFELFRRGVGCEVNGTGAGLAIVREIAERHGGAAFARPRQGGGSEFVVTFGGRKEDGRVGERFAA